MIRKLLRDPLAHFLVAGAAIWGLLALAGDPVDPASRTIELSRERQAGIALGFERMMGRPPTDAEMDWAIERWIREEVLYREALRLGIDEGDAIVRRRLATKMDELAGAEAEVARPSDAALEQWLADNPGAYAMGGTVTFEQAYFPSERAARAAMTEASPEGEPISLPRSVARMPLTEVRVVFGREFAAELSALAAGPDWQGPIGSGYGWHLVRLAKRDGGSGPPLAEIRDRVEADWRSATIAERRQRAYEVLREAYTVEVE
ncbi:MAG: peptidyl-prolyl cis-trans isomerase [Erythrobacter sp.]|uniref:peptidylprolyl isomerase n=1 Tax=Erythrobacter sp. TaxID=1042 RepID=UPI001B235DAC|nr:peptidylprolyl isomerase [Erythrobacter sp.]MBO6766953.1 peptidyl-prolyl cis-trans isomerase [Erythrobacter sp.]